MDNRNLTKRTYIYVGIISASLILMTLIGIYGWYSYVFPNLLRIGTFSSSAIIVFAFLAGLASFFSPCVFALLPAYMSYFFTLRENRSLVATTNPRNKKSPLIIGLSGALGMFVFILPFGAAVSVLGWGSVPYLRLFSPLMGVLFIILGTALLMNYTFNMGLIQKLVTRSSTAEEDPYKKIFLYGIAYAAGSAGCTTPILLALIVFSLVSGGLFLTLSTLLAYSAAMGFLMIIITMLAAKSKDEILEKLSMPTSAVKEGSGIVLILTGILLIIIYVFLNLL